VTASIAQLKSAKSVFAYFFTTDEVIITKLDRNIKQIKIFTQIYKFVRRRGRGLGHATYFDSFYITGMGKVGYFKFGVRIDRQVYKPKMQK